MLLDSVAQGLVRFDANGNIVPGLAERWNVSDDGLSYIFRIATKQWPDGTRITAQQVARLLKRQLSEHSRNPLKESVGAIEDIVAMTDRVIEIQLIAPRPTLLALLAQPEFAILKGNDGTGPFSAAATGGAVGGIMIGAGIMAPFHKKVTGDSNRPDTRRSVSSNPSCNGFLGRHFLGTDCAAFRGKIVPHQCTSSTDETRLNRIRRITT